MKKCVMVINPQSRKAKKIDFQILVNILKGYNYETELIYTKYSKDATNIVKNLPEDVDLVISCGGDGTLNEVVTGNMSILTEEGVVSEQYRFFTDTEIDDSAHFKYLLYKYKIGDTIKITYMRDQKIKETNLKLDKKAENN